ncbi:hypothetical protein AB1N83_013270, partial [Pleurotus pulmonarius]
LRPPAATRKWSS